MNSSIKIEFDRQVNNLLQKGYPKQAKLSVEEFLKHTESLRIKLDSTRLKEKPIPFVLVVTSALIFPRQAMPLIEIKNQKGIVNMEPLQPEDFQPISVLRIPKSPLYLITGVDTGRQYLNIRPEDALQDILKNKRSPLTIDEGISLLTQFPETLTDKRRFNAFQMAGSRRNDQRVPSIWISYHKPRLGWCWDRNPHTWLGTASCTGRI